MNSICNFDLQKIKHAILLLYYRIDDHYFEFE